MLRAAKEQVLGRRVLGKTGTGLWEAGCSVRGPQGRDLGMGTEEGGTLERSQEAGGSGSSLKSQAPATHPPPVTLQGLKTQAGV